MEGEQDSVLRKSKLCNVFRFLSVAIFFNRNYPHSILVYYDFFVVVLPYGTIASLSIVSSWDLNES